MRIGVAMGEPFRQGLLKASGVETAKGLVKNLDLRGKLTGEQHTAVGGIAQMMLTNAFIEMDLRGYDLSSDEIADYSISMSRRVCGNGRWKFRIACPVSSIK